MRITDFKKCRKKAGLAVFPAKIAKKDNPIPVAKKYKVADHSCKI